MKNRTCSMPGCTKPHRARDMCATHYNQVRYLPSERHPVRTITCATCGLEHATVRTDGRFCSLACRDVERAEQRMMRLLPVLHPAPRRVQRTVIAKPARAPRCFVSAQCSECMAWFVDRQTTARFCSPLCAKRWWRKDWKSRTKRSVPQGVRLHVYERDQGVCQLCFKPVNMTLGPRDPLGPTLDHVVCQSWTLIPDHTAGNLRLAHRLCNSLRGDRA